MKISLRFRTASLCLLLCVALAVQNSPAQQPQQQDDYKILGVRTYTSNDLIKVGNAWRKDLPQRIQATLRVGADTPSASVFVKAYFYDRDNHLIGTYTKPNKIWAATARGFEEVGLPATLSRTKTTDVYFAIPEDLRAKQWTTVLVVFGSGSKVAASANPATATSKLDFPEKAQVAPPSL